MICWCDFSFQTEGYDQQVSLAVIGKMSARNGVSRRDVEETQREFS